MRYSIEDKTLNELFHSCRVARDKYAENISGFTDGCVLNDEEPIWVMTSWEECQPESNLMRVRIEVTTGEEEFAPFGFCSGSYETVEEAKMAEDYTVIHWEDLDSNIGTFYYATIPNRFMTFVIDEANTGIVDIWIEAFMMPVDEEGFDITELGWRVRDLMPERSIEEIEITEDGIYGGDMNEGLPLYNRVIVNTGGGGEVFNEVTIKNANSNCKPFTYNVLNQWIDGKPFTINTDYLGGLFEYSSKLKDLSQMVINYKGTQPTHSIFSSCNNLEHLPTINVEGNFKSANLNGMFEYCNWLQRIPDEMKDSIRLFIQDTTENIMGARIFNNCFSLREPPNLKEILDGKHIYNTTSCFYNQTFKNCYALNEIRDLPVLMPVSGGLTNSSCFMEIVNYCHQLKEFTFVSDQQADWDKQTINLSSYVGYAVTRNNLFNYNAGIPEFLEVTDDDTYQAMKHYGSEYWTTNVNYSHYNHDSAVNTLNSLPDTSHFGTNTIKFKGQSGALTDGGAINTLTEEEIAVATAKGWTVSFV